LKRIFSQDSRLRWLCDGGRLLVPTRRLAFYLRQHYDRAVQRSGAATWPSAGLLTWPDLVALLFRERRSALAFPPRWLSPAAARLVWDDVVRADVAAESMLAVSGVASAAHRAWQRLHEYEIPLPAIAQHDAAEHEAFARWVAAYRERLSTLRAVDAATALRHVGPDQLAGLRLALTGFDALTPQQTRFLAEAAELGIEVPTLEPEWPVAVVQRCACPTRDAEYDSAARWAAGLLSSVPERRIAIVVDELDRERDSVRRALDRVLNPASGFNATPAGGGTAFTIATSRSLSAWPMVVAALDLLDSFSESPAQQHALSLLREPFIAGGDVEAAPRAALDVRLRDEFRRELDLQRLRAAAAANGAPQLAAGLGAALELRSQWPARAQPSDWAREFATLLTALGWPGAGLDSVEHQTHERWLGLLATLGACDSVVAPLTAREALRMLRAATDDTQFEPEQLDAPVLVIDPRTSAGMQFDAVWVCGLEAGRWPAPASPDPFLPWHWQQRQRLPGASAALCVEEAERTLARLRRSAGMVVLSHPAMDRDAGLLPSPLLRDVPPMHGGAIWPAETLTRTLFAARPALERRWDPRLPALEPGSVVRGGASLLEKQSACAFRAQAEFRLLAQPLAERSPGIDAATRGRLVHSVLEQVWGELGDSRRLAETEASALERLVDGVVAATIATLRGTDDPVFARFVALEARWLRTRALELLAVDRTRPPFEVLAREQTRDISLEGVTLRVKLDRVDRLLSGGVAIVDYKTSKAEPRTWTGERPEQPQLPAYVLAIEDASVAAVAFARLRAGDTTYVGLTSDASLWALGELGSRRGDLAGFASWDDALAQWRRRLANLMAEFRRGDATLAADPVKACRYCHLGTLCRVAEIVPAQDEDDETPESSDVD
jgi:ATP-dependent helicase/nuclease subunit B